MEQLLQTVAGSSCCTHLRSDPRWGGVRWRGAARQGGARQGATENCGGAGGARQGATGRRKGAAWLSWLLGCLVIYTNAPPPSEATAAPPVSGRGNGGARLRGDGAVKIGDCGDGTVNIGEKYSCDHESRPPPDSRRSGEGGASASGTWRCRAPPFLATYRKSRRFTRGGPWCGATGKSNGAG